MTDSSPNSGSDQIVTRTTAANIAGSLGNSRRPSGSAASIPATPWSPANKGTPAHLSGQTGKVDQTGSSRSSRAVFERRILPLLTAKNPSTCAECHLSGVDLKDYIRPTESETFAGLREQAHCGMRRVSKLRHEPAEIDRVGGGQPMFGRERLLRESGFHQPLAVVEIAVDLDCQHLIAPTGELALLKGGNPPFWEQDHRAHRGTPLSGTADRPSGVA